MKVLIATDGSEFSRDAVKECCKIISTQKHTDIKIISVVEPVAPMTAEPFAISADFYGLVEAGFKQQAKEAVADTEKLIKGTLSDENIIISTEVFRGNIKQGIIETAKQFEADLIVVGSHGYGFFERVLLGSISSYVVHHAPCSVLVVRNKVA